MTAIVPDAVVPAAPDNAATSVVTLKADNGCDCAEPAEIALAVLAEKFASGITLALMPLVVGAVVIRNDAPCPDAAEISDVALSEELLILAAGETLAEKLDVDSVATAKNANGETDAENADIEDTKLGAKLAIGETLTEPEIVAAVDGLNEVFGDTLRLTEGAEFSVVKPKLAEAV